VRRANCRIHGIAKEEIIGKNAADLYPDTESEWFIKYALALHVFGIL
jgi:hypothetical protein